jgi:hypothetical protein
MPWLPAKRKSQRTPFRGFSQPMLQYLSQQQPPRAMMEWRQQQRRRQPLQQWEDFPWG